MRIGGLATGMDIDQLVEKLMEAERMPLDKMQQDKQKLEWKRDSFRDINRALLELDDLILKMRLSSNYKTKQVSSSQEGAVTAEASSDATDGNYRIQVNKLATSTINVGGQLNEDVTDGPLGEKYAGHYKFYTYDENGKELEHGFDVNVDDTLEDVLKRISEDDNNVRAFYDKQSNQVVLESTRTGRYRPEEPENATEIFIKPADEETGTDYGMFFRDVLNLDMSAEKSGENASFTYNGELTLESRDNSYELNGIHLNFHNVTEGDAQLIVQNDTEEAFDNIMEFIDKYNEVIELLNNSQMEERHRDFPPLTDEQKAEMTEDQIEKWEEKAKSGLLRGESLISNTLYSMRRNLYEKVETGGAFTTLTQLGLETSKNYLDGGKIVLKDSSPDTLKKALEEDIDSVMKLFTNREDGDSKGLMQRLDETVDAARKQISERAGRQTSLSLEDYTMGKQMKTLNERIDAFERRLVQVETRYWNQFTAMEKAIQRMNMQSAQLMQQFGGGM